MPTPNYIQPGEQLVADSAVSAARGDRQGATSVSQLHGRYYEQTFRKKIFSVATSAGQTSSVGAAATIVGLTVSNPIGSPVNLAMNKFGYGFSVVFAAASVIGLQVGYNASTNVTHTTPATILCNFVGSPKGYALADTTCTVPTAATLQMILNSAGTAAVSALFLSNQGWVDLEGSFLIPPGGYIATYTSTASGAAGTFASFQFEEVPV